MSSPKTSPDHRSHNATETSPLLPPTPPTSPPIPDQLSTAKLAVILGSIWIGVFLAALDSTVIATLLSPISSSFQSFATIGWITTAYLIAQAALQPLIGKLTDIYGRRAGLLVANVLFGLGTLACGVAGSEGVMIAGRIVAGAGGGGLTTISSIVASDLVPLRKRGVVQGLGNIAYGGGAALGGLYGGIIADTLGWRWAFILQIPLIAVSSIAVFFMVKIPITETSLPSHHRIDFSGALTLVTFLVLFLLSLSSSSRGPIEPGAQASWEGPPLAFASLLFLAFFIFIELRVAREPILPLNILRSRTASSVLITFAFLVGAMFCAYFYIPIFFLLSGGTPTSAGLRLTPFAVGISAGSLSSGLIMNRTGRYYLLGLTVMVIFNLGVGSFTLFTPETPTAPEFIGLLAFGWGYGAALTVGITALMAAVSHELQAVTTSASYLFRATGGTVGAAVGSAVFQGQLRRELVERLGESKEAREVAKRVLMDFDEVFKVPVEWRVGVIDAYQAALRSVFAVALAMGVVALVAVGCMDELTLHKRLDRKGDDDEGQVGEDSE